MDTIGENGLFGEAKVAAERVVMGVAGEAVVSRVQTRAADLRGMKRWFGLPAVSGWGGGEDAPWVMEYSSTGVDQVPTRSIGWDALGPNSARTLVLEGTRIPGVYWGWRGLGM